MDKMNASVSQKSENVVSRETACDLLGRMLGGFDQDEFVRVVGVDSVNTVLDGIAMAINESHVHQRIIEYNDNDFKLRQIYGSAIRCQTAIKAKYYDEEKLKILGDKIYAASYGFVDKKPEIKEMLRHYSPHNGADKCIIFIRKIMKNLSNEFDVPEPKIVFLNISGFCHGLHLPNCIVMSMDDKDIMGLITHEFVHYLQRYHKTAAGAVGIMESRKYSIVRKFLCWINCGKYTELIDQVYNNSLIESEAGFIANYVFKKNRDKLYANTEQIVTVLKNAQLDKIY